MRAAVDLVVAGEGEEDLVGAVVGAGGVGGEPAEEVMVVVCPEGEGAARRWGMGGGGGGLGEACGMAWREAAALGTLQ